MPQCWALIFSHRLDKTNLPTYTPCFTRTVCGCNILRYLRSRLQTVDKHRMNVYTHLWCIKHPLSIFLLIRIIHSPKVPTYFERSILQIIDNWNELCRCSNNTLTCFFVRTYLHPCLLSLPAHRWRRSLLGLVPAPTPCAAPLSPSTPPAPSLSPTLGWPRKQGVDRACKLACPLW